MTPLPLDEVVVYVEQNIGQFHQRRLSSLERLKLKDILKRKNPYLFKAKHIGITYIVSIKSGPNWGNSSQIKKMVDNFKKAQRILRTSGGPTHVRCVNGCCYGRESRPDKGDYLKLCGQEFWQFVSGDERFYLDIIEPLGHRAKQRNEEFDESYGRVLNRFTREFIDEFCPNDAIDWERLVQFNSGAVR